MTIVNDNRANESTKESEKNEAEKAGSIEKTSEKLAKSGWLENWPPSMGAASMNDQDENHFLLDIERWGLEMDGLTQGQGLSQRRPSPESKRVHPNLVVGPVPQDVSTDEGGSLAFSPSQMGRWGLTPNTRFTVIETRDGLVLRRADPALNRVYIEPTSKCNLSCRTCVRHSWKEPMGTLDFNLYEELLAGLRRVPSLRSIAFWGFGEPLLHPNIAEMVAQATEMGVATEMISNGLLLDQAMADDLIEAGLGKIVFSIDGVSPELQSDIHGGADLARVQENILRLNERRSHHNRPNPEVGIEFVAMRRNLHELPKLRKLARHLEARSITITNLLPYTPDLVDETLYGFWAGRCYTEPSQWEPEVNLPRMDARRPQLDSIVGLLEHAGSTVQPYGWQGKRAGYCRFSAEGSTFVAWDGGVSPCPALLHSYKSYVLGREKSIRRYTLGNIREQSLRDIFGAKEYVDFRARLEAFDFSPCTDCGSCELAEKNEEDCFGNHFPVCGDCLWAKGVIQCP